MSLHEYPHTYGYFPTERITLGVNPRPIDWEHVFDLQRSMLYDGQTSPGDAYKDGDKLVLIKGFHRYHACVQLKRPMYLRVFETKPPEDYLDRLALSDVTQLEVDPLSKYFAILKYCEDHECSLRQAGEILRIDTSIISKFKYLLDLPEEAQGYVRTRTLPADTGIAIAKGFKDQPEEMMRLAKEAVAGRLTAKQVREMAASRNGTAKEERAKTTYPANWSIEKKVAYHKAEARALEGK